MCTVRLKSKYLLFENVLYYSKLKFNGEVLI